MNPHVLIVDDEPNIIKVMERICSRKNISAITASDTASAIALFAENEFDVVITDIIMPGGDGLTFIKWLRAHQPHCKIIASSGGGGFGPAIDPPSQTPSSLEAALAAGAHYVLEKPFGMPEFVALINQAANDT